MKTNIMILTFILTSILLQGCGTLCPESKDGGQCAAMNRDRMDRFDRFEPGSRGGR